MTETPTISNLQKLNGVFNQNVSIFGNTNITENPKHQLFKDVLFDIQSGVYAELTNKARELTPDELKEYKRRNVPAFTLSAYCKNRKASTPEAEKLIKHTGILQIDFDFKEGITPEALNELKQKINADKHTLFSYISISGIGLKAGILIDGSKHKESFIQAEKYYIDNYGLQIDKSVKDIFRLCFVSYDIDLFVNQNAELFGISEPEVIKDSAKLQKPKTMQVSINTNKLDKIKDNAIKNLLSYIGKATDGNRHLTRNKASFIAGGYVAGGVLSEQEILPLIIQESDRISDTGSTPDSELKTIQESFESGKSKPIYKDVKIAEYEKHCKDNRKYTSKPVNVNKDTGEIMENSIEHCFWYETEGRNKEILLKIEYVPLYAYLKSIGIRKIYLDETLLKNVLVRIIDNVVFEIDFTYIRNTINHFIESLPDKISENMTRNDLLETFGKGIDAYINDNKFDGFIPCEKIEFMQDSEHSAFIFYNNGFVDVTKETKTLKDYKDLPSHIWQSQKLKRNFEVIQDFDIQKINNFAFTQWIRNICSTKEPKQIDKERYNALICTIGYLLHNYKTKSNKFAPVLSEANLDDTSKGGTGKGLIMQAIGKIRKVATIDGKNFSFDSQFAFQNVTLDTQILFIDDVKKFFPFDRLYSAITEGLSFEQKHKDRINLTPEQSPKIVISTNFAISGNSESDKRRKYEMELLTYYDSKHKPIHDFGKEFFSEWNDNEWNLFDNFMLTCIQVYFENDSFPNLPLYSSATKDEKKLLIATSQEFIEYADTLEIGIEIKAGQVYDNYLEYARLTAKDFLHNVLEII